MVFGEVSLAPCAVVDPIPEEVALGETEGSAKSLMSAAEGAIDINPDSLMTSTVGRSYKIPSKT